MQANATTTPKIRHSIQASTQSVTQLANELGVSEDTIRRWKRRDGVADGSHPPHRLPTTLTLAQEVVWSWRYAKRCCCRLMTCWW